MTNEEYDELIKKYNVEDKVLENVLISFITGGLAGIIAEALTELFVNYFKCSLSDAYLLTTTSFIVSGSIMTGLGFFDKVLSFSKCGLIVPSTGFANSMTSSSMDYKGEGFIKGIGANMFKLTGSIIAYGIIFGIIFGFIRSMI